ncbi:MAG: hydrogenase maturation nickel metallochaperone HypA [Anaerolineae bacterium]
MHEFAVTQGVLATVLEHAEKAKARRVTQINLVIGDMTGIIDDSVQFYFDVLSEGTIAQGATLSFQRIPTQMRCHHCGRIFTPQDLDWHCPDCGQLSFEVVAGKEFYVDSIEVE